MKKLHKYMMPLGVSIVLLIIIFGLSFFKVPSSTASKSKGLSKKELIEALKNGECTHDGHNLFGKVKFVNSFPDLKIKFVEHFPDIKVKYVTSFPDDCGEWKIVESFPDLKVQVVEHFPDIKVQVVEHFPGMK